MSHDLEEDFRKALYSLDHRKVIDFFREMAESERRSLAPLVAKLGFEAWHSAGAIPDEAIPGLREITERLCDGRPTSLDMLLQGGAPYQALEPKINAYELATAVAGIAVLIPEEYGNAYWTTPALPHVEEILLDRNPPWMEKIYETENWIFTRYEWFRIYWHFVLTGQVPRRNDDQMIRHIVAALPEKLYQSEILSLREKLLRLPELFESEFWRIFEIPLQLSPVREYLHDKTQRWDCAIAELAVNREIDRNRLFKSLATMLNREMHDPAIKWCVGIFKDAKPDERELADILEDLLPLLDSKQIPVYTFACDSLIKVAKKNVAFDTVLLSPLEKLLRDKSKARAKQCLGILEAIQKRSPQHGEAVQSLFLLGLQHEAAEVQATALKQVQKFLKNDPKTTERLRKLAPSLAPSVRAELNLDVPETKKPAAKPSALQPPELTGRLTHLSKLTPVQTVEELIDLALKIIEAPTDCDEHELLLDGLDRLHNRRDDNFVAKTSSLRKAVLAPRNLGMIPFFYSWKGESLDEPVGIDNYAYYLAAAIALWIADERSVSPDGKYFNVTLNGNQAVLDFVGKPDIEVIFGNRIMHLARRMCNGITHQSLSTPTHTGGWIDPVVFVERIIADPNKLVMHDLNDYILALYRLAPDRRLEALELLKDDKDENIFTTTLKFLLGDPQFSYTEEDILKDEASLSPKTNPWREKAQHHLDHAFEPASRRAIGFVERLQFQTQEERQNALEKLRLNPKPFVEYEVVKELSELLSLHYPELKTETADDSVEKAAETQRNELLVRKALITAAILVRNPASDPVRYTLDKYPDAASTIRTRFLKRNGDNDAFPLYYIHKPFTQPYHYENKWVGGLIRWRMTVFPSHREPLYWNAIPSLFAQVEAGGSYTAPHGFIETLLDPQEPMGDAATAAVLIALAAKPTGLAMLAQDILIASIGEGRLVAGRLVPAVEFHLRNELPKTNRWHEKFNVIAGVSPLHAAVIRETLDQTLPAFPLKQTGPFVELLYELCVADESPLVHQTTLDFLKRLTGKTGQTAKKLLAMK